MLDKNLIDKLLQLKAQRGYTLHDLSKRLDLQVTTIERWLKTKHINKIYANLVRERLDID
jgi:transcriptional regulator with XRE-family HTH domain